MRMIERAQPAPEFTAKVGDLPILTGSLDQSQAAPPFPLPLQEDGLWVCSYTCCLWSLLALILVLRPPVAFILKPWVFCPLIS